MGILHFDIFVLESIFMAIEISTSFASATQLKQPILRVNFQEEELEGNEVIPPFIFFGKILL